MAKKDIAEDQNLLRRAQKAKQKARSGGMKVSTGFSMFEAKKEIKATNRERYLAEKAAREEYQRKMAVCRFVDETLHNWLDQADKGKLVEISVSNDNVKMALNELEGWIASFLVPKYHVTYVAEHSYRLAKIKAA